ncbi:Corrinoid adenosyltransferase [subsurface metagenome]|nr:cob(I)yrinic acid a,c-diamide adenosyltransferase [Clostridia bacterium]
MDLEKKNNCSQNICGKDSKEGTVLINTGNGKGKTTAALGLALRAAGHNFRVLILQFIKGRWKTGEAKIMGKLKPLIEIEQLGRGFIKFKNGKPQPTSQQIDNAIESFRYAREKIYSGKYDMVILDEINNLIDYGLLKVEDVVDLIKNKPKEISIVLTGRNAHHKLVDIADTVTEMKEVKHAFSNGIKARKGIEY